MARASIRFSSAKDAGFALAAVLADDRELARIEGHVESGVHARIRALATSPQLAKPVLIAQLLALLRPPLAVLSPLLPVRLRALLAPQLPRSEGRSVLAGAPLTRAGFEPERELLARLARIARFSSPEAERARREAGAQVPS